MSKNDSFLLDVRHIDDHLVLTKNSAWVYFIVPGQGASLPTQEHLNDLVANVDTVLDGLDDDTELHYHVAYRDLDTESWANQLDTTSTEATPAWTHYRERMRKRISQRGYQQRMGFLGVRLGTRTNVDFSRRAGTSPFEHARMALKSLTQAAAGPDLQPKAQEVARWRARGDKVRAAMQNSALHAIPAKANDVAWLIRHVQRLGMPEPTPLDDAQEWGAGKVVSLAEAVVDNSDASNLTLSLTGRNTNIGADLKEWEANGQQSAKPTSAFTRHVAILSVSSIPELTGAPWLFHASTMPFPVELSARIKVLSNVKAEKDAADAVRKQANALQDAKDAGESGHSQDQRRASGAQRLRHELAEGEGRRQIIGSYRLIVSSPDREETGARAEEVIRHFREEAGVKVTVVWPPGDQLELWKEMLPGQENRVGLYQQRQDLVTFAVALPFMVTTAGDDEGPYIGEVLTGSPSPVFYDLATAAKRGQGPTCAVTGTLGGGKTFLLLTLIDHFRLRGFPLIVLDPKGDAKGHLHLTGRGDVRFFDLSTEGKPGSLDPYRLVPLQIDVTDPERDTHEKALQRQREETRTLVTDVVRQLLADSLDRVMDTAVTMALNAEMELPSPSMANLLNTLAAGGVTPTETANISAETLSNYRMAAIGAHAQLKNYSETQLGRLLFAPAGAEADNDLLQSGVSSLIVSLSGLTLPEPGEEVKPVHRISTALFSLVAHQARTMLQDLDYVGPRGLFIDEAHQITAIPSGRSMIISNGRMGRSRDIAMVLATQSTADLVGDALRNVISGVFAFRTGTTTERENVAELLGREKTDPMVAAMLPTKNEKPGTCLFLDIDDNLVKMRVDAWASEYKGAFDTNPTREGVSAAGTRILTDAYGIVRDPELVRTTPVAPPSYIIPETPSLPGTMDPIVQPAPASASVQVAAAQPVYQQAPVAPTPAPVQMPAPLAAPVAPQPVAPPVAAPTVAPAAPVTTQPPTTAFDEDWWSA